MKTRFLVILALGAWLGLSSWVPAWALDVAASGTLTDDATKREGKWTGQFTVEVTHFDGTVSLSGVEDVATQIGVRGSFNGRSISFGSSKAGGPQVVFSGRWSRTKGLTGTFQIGARTGTWTGAFGTARGGSAPAAAAVEEYATPLAAFRSEGPPAGLDPDNPGSSCTLLNDARTMQLISGPGESALRQFCEGEAVARVPSSRTTWLLAALGERIRSVLGMATAAPPTNVPVNDRTVDVWDNVTQSEISTGVSAANQDIMVTGFNDTGHPGTGSLTGWSRSTDRGASWLDRGFLAPVPGGSVSGDPAVVTGAGPQANNMYFGTLARTAASVSIIGVARSTDNGNTFSAPVNASPSSTVGFQDKPEMTVDKFAQTSPNAGNIYACWTDFGSGGIRFSRSVDGGVTYTQVVGSISGSTNVQGCAIAVGPLGDVYVAWWDAGVNQIRLRRSTDGGQSFLGEVTVGSAVPPSVVSCCGRSALAGGVSGSQSIRLIPFGNLATDSLASSNVYSVWNTQVSGSSEVYFSRSTNNGASWSAAVRLNDVVTNDQFLPRISSGVLFEANPNVTHTKVMWYDRRLDPNNLMFDVFADTSTDGGVTWGTDVRWTEVSSTPPQTCPNFDCGIASCYMGDYNAMSTLNPSSSEFILGWGDTRLTASGTACAAGRPSSGPDPDVRAARGC